jgi:phosphatidylglycerophosphate synthase
MDEQHFHKNKPSQAMTPNLSLTEALNRWSGQNATLMLIGLAGAMLMSADSPPFAAALAGGSFLGLLIRFRGRWTPNGRFGPANAITLLRLLGALALLLWSAGSEPWAAGLAFLILCADGLDGWAARRWGAESEFGRLFDQEVDAFTLLVLCLILYTQGHLGAWVLLPGALRYLFVLFAGRAKPSRRTAQGNRFTRAMGVIAMLALIACLLPIGETCFWLAAGATLGLCGSFLHSTRRLYRPEVET